MALGFHGAERMGRLARPDWARRWRAGGRWPRCRLCTGRLAELGPDRISWCPTCDTPERTDRALYPPP